MDPSLAPPPPPSNHLFHEGGTRPTYWLYTGEKGMEGPYTKKEAQGIIGQNPNTAFLACREGEEWKDAAVRLARKKKPFPWRYLVMVILVPAVAYGAWRWHLSREAERPAQRKAMPVNTAPAGTTEADATKAKLAP